VCRAPHQIARAPDAKNPVNLDSDSRKDLRGAIFGPLQNACGAPASLNKETKRVPEWSGLAPRKDMGEGNE